MNRTFFLLNNLYLMTHIPVHYISPTDDVILFSMGYTDTTNPLYCDKELRQKLCKITENTEYPALDTEFSSIIYASFPDFMGNCIILGPISFHQYNHDLIYQYKQKHSIKDTLFSLKYINPEIFSAELCSMFYMINDKMLEQSQIDVLSSSSNSNLSFSQNQVQTYILDNSEKGKKHFKYSEEQKMMDIIRNGDIDAVKYKISIDDLKLSEEMVGKMADMPLKNFEYMVCSSISIMTRAAIEGGLDSITAYSMSDIYLQRLARCNDFKSIGQLHIDAKTTFVQAVHNSRSQQRKSSYIEHCKNYISNHLNKPFTLDDIALEIGLNKTYLSRKFNEIEHICIFEYTQKKRIEVAKNMLKYSNENISTIANYLCFSSQSHFCSVFKKYTNMTPKKYRDAEKLIDFS